MTAAPHLLVIRRRYLGDIVLLGSFLRNLRLHWPDARLTVLTEPAYSAVLALNPDVSAALALPRRTTDWPAFLGLLRRARFTHVFDLDNTQKTDAEHSDSGNHRENRNHPKHTPFRHQQRLLANVDDLAPSRGRAGWQ